MKRRVVSCILPLTAVWTLLGDADCEITYEWHLPSCMTLSVRTGDTPCSLVMAYGAEDRGEDIAAWDSALVLSSLDSGETVSMDVSFPQGWGKTVGAMRFFATDRELRMTSDGASYFDTAWTNSSDDVIEMVFQHNDPGVTDFTALYGCRKASNANGKNISLYRDGNGFGLDFNDGNLSELRLRQVEVNDGQRHRMVNSAERRLIEHMSAGTVRRAQTNDTECTAVFKCPGSAYLFSINDMEDGSPKADTWPNPDNMRFYSLTIKKTDGTSCCDMRPCKIDGTVKLYDSVRKRYFENLGTGHCTFEVVGSGFMLGDTGTVSVDSAIPIAGFYLILR